MRIYVLATLFAVMSFSGLAFSQETEIAYSQSQGRLVEVPKGSGETLGYAQIRVSKGGGGGVQDGDKEVVYSRSEGRLKVVPAGSGETLGRASLPYADKKVKPSLFQDEDGRNYKKSNGHWIREDGVVCKGSMNNLDCGR